MRKYCIPTTNQPPGGINKNGSQRMFACAREHGFKLDATIRQRICIQCQGLLVVGATATVKLVHRTHQSRVNQQLHLRRRSLRKKGQRVTRKDQNVRNEILTTCLLCQHQTTRKGRLRPPPSKSHLPASSNPSFERGAKTEEFIALKQAPTKLLDLNRKKKKRKTGARTSSSSSSATTSQLHSFLSALKR